MKYGRNKRKGISLLLALLMLCSIIAEQARPVAYAADLTELDGAAETEESARLPEDGAFGEDAALEGPSEEPGSEEEQTSEDPSEAIQDEPGDEPSDEAPEDDLTEPEEGEAVLDQPEELPDIEEIAMEERLLGVGPMKVAGSGAYTIYFVVPSDWTGYDRIVFNACMGKNTSQGGDPWTTKDMENTGLTYENLPLYSAAFTAEECIYSVFNNIQFQAWLGNSYQKEVEISGETSSSTFNGKIYYNNGWVEYKPDGYDKFAGKTMVFENRSDSALPVVKAVFYLKGENGELTRAGDPQTVSNVANNKGRASFTIPTDECNYVQFFDENDQPLSDCCNFYGEDAATGEKSFRFNETTTYCYRYTGDPSTSSWGTIGGTTVYFDATFSKLEIAQVDVNQVRSDDDHTYYSIPNSGNGNVYYYVDAEHNGTMTKENDNLYSIEVPAGATQIAFASFDMKDLGLPTESRTDRYGKTTKTLTIPTNLNNPCFYADASDVAMYENQFRDGYWDEVGQIRSAEGKTKTINNGTDVVNINQETFVPGTGVHYVNSTFYDYYTDYELNGYNRDNYPGNFAVNYRSWYPFRQFEQALSDAYKAKGVSIPIYTGHFQPDWDNWGTRFSAIASTLGLYGYNNTDQKPFMSTNNSTMNLGGLGEHDNNGQNAMYAYAAQGLVNSTLKNGTTLMTKDNTMALPHFDESFLLGNNSKNAVLGDVYHNVAFPFQKVVDEHGVEYWQFDSAQTTLAMRQDPSTGEYYLKNVGNQDWSKNVNSSSGTNGVSNTYGFFPFNDGSAATCASTYNYGFGTKLEFKFRLTEDGKVTGTDGQQYPITFEFSGDDDVWVFIDGQLALDVGGAHGRVDGTLNFGTMQATVSAVKKSLGSDTQGTNVTSSFSIKGEKSSEHTLTMFYMERGMWESNMKVRFNFPDENQLSVEKKVDTSDVNSLFKDVFDDLSLFTFQIQNLATHYGTKSASQQAITTQVASVSDAANTLYPGYTGNIFQLASDDWTRDGKRVAYWYAKEEDRDSAYRNRRYGILELGAPINIAAGSDRGYLDFEFYFNWNDDTPKLNEMYLQLVDTQDKTLGSDTETLAGKTYGTVYLTNNSWVKVRVDLSKLTAESGFNNRVKSIRFGYNYPRNIYLTDFTYIPPVTATAKVGFRTQQNEIPDYGSATSGNLENATDAVYTSNTGRTGVVDNEGKFVLAKDETVTFYDQFRRGSYIALSEVLEGQAQNLFSTKWTMYDADGKAVTTFGSGNTVTNPGTTPSMKNVSGTAVDDGRTENKGYLDSIDETSGNEYQKGAAHRPADANTFVFRSYSDPDNNTTVTKLSAVFTNKVNVGSLTICKEKAYEVDELSDTYRFVVIFTNVGGLGLEDTPIQTEEIQLRAGESHTITGIPVGTDYTIRELKPTDGSKLDRVERDGETVAFTAGSAFYAVTGTIANEANATVSYTFENTKKPTVDISVKKEWKDAETNELTNPPDQIYIKLQRSTDGTSWSDVGSAVAIGPSSQRNETWADYIYTFSEQDQYVDYTAEPKVEYQYRVVEVNADGSPLTDSRVTIDGTTFAATYEERAGVKVITNTVVPPPKTDLQITKVDAENASVKLDGVVFKLEQQSGSDWTNLGTQTTNGDGLATFRELADGTYRLTETQTKAGYNLLSGPILIRIEDGTYRIDSGEEQTITGNTIALTVRNHKGYTLPETGGTRPNLALIGGLALAATALLIYSFAFYGRKKGARRKRK